MPIVFGAQCRDGGPKTTSGTTRCKRVRRKIVERGSAQSCKQVLYKVHISRRQTSYWVAICDIFYGLLVGKPNRRNVKLIVIYKRKVKSNGSWCKVSNVYISTACCLSKPYSKSVSVQEVNRVGVYTYNISRSFAEDPGTLISYCRGECRVCVTARKIHKIFVKIDVSFLKCVRSCATHGSDV